MIGLFLIEYETNPHTTVWGKKNNETNPHTTCGKRMMRQIPTLRVGEEDTPSGI